MNPWESRMERVVAAFASTYRRDRIVVGERTFSILHADTPEKRRAGMAGQVGLVDGMLFDMGTLLTATFHMKQIDTPILIAFFGPDGDLINSAYMDPETGSARCLRPFRWALELAVDPATALDVLPALIDGLHLAGR